MVSRIDLGEIFIDVLKKDIKNIHLSVNPPNGKVKISAPLRMSLDAIRLFAISKLGWIKTQQNKMRSQPRETPREYLEKESHFVWGQRYLLRIIEANVTPHVELTHSDLVLTVRPGSGEEKRQEIVQKWYREQLRVAVAPLVHKWEQILGVQAAAFFVRKMKTRWGSCNPSSRYIRFNTDLAKKPSQCLEYIVVHELIHLLEPTHNKNFIDLMDQHLPTWKCCRDHLNSMPVSHEDWRY